MALNVATVESGLLAVESSDVELISEERRTFPTRLVAGVLATVGLGAVALGCAQNYGATTAAITEANLIAQQQVNANAGGGDSWIYNGLFPIDPNANILNPFAPVEKMNDGNACQDDEEFLGGLCYAKCSSLTQGKATYRMSAFACCEKKDPTQCGFKNQIFNFAPCSGLDVGGTIGGKSGQCPHTPGSCLTNEEYFLGSCFMKCTSLTSGDFPTRTSPTTCCKGTGIQCLTPSNVKISSAFDVGGGIINAGSQQSDVPKVPHSPIQDLTENPTTMVPGIIR